MGDIGDIFRDLKQHRREQREKFGVKCPVCSEKRPKSNPTILLPEQRCRVCGHIDPRRWQELEKQEHHENTTPQTPS